MKKDRAIEILIGQVEINKEWLKDMDAENRKPFEELIEALEMGIDALKEKGEEYEEGIFRT